MLHHVYLAKRTTGRVPDIVAKMIDSVNFLGVPVSGVVFEATMEYTTVNQTVHFTTTWEIGTDVVYRIDFNDSHAYSWDFITANHTEHFYDQSTQTEHTFNVPGNMTVALLIGNGVANLTYSTMVYVEPDLGRVLSLYLDYNAQHSPSPVRFYISQQPPLPPDYILIWCSIEFGDGSEKSHVFAELEGIYHFDYTYMTHKSNATPSVMCANHMSNVTLMSQVILRKPINDVEIIPWAQHGTAFENSTFNITIANGSDAQFHITYGNGDQMIYSHPNVYSDQETFVINKQYVDDGVFIIKVKAYNEYFNDSTALSYLVQHKVYNLNLTGPHEIKYPPGRGDFLLDFISVIPSPSNVTCNWTVDSVQLDSIASPELSNGQPYNHSHYNSRDQLGTNMILDVVCYNLVSNQHLYHVYSMYEVISGLNVYLEPRMLATQQIGYLNISLTNGSDVSFNVSFGDQQIFWQKHPHRLSFRDPVVLNKSYSAQGNYSITIYAENVVSNYVTNMTDEVIVQNLIIDLVLDVTNDTIWPPGTVELNVSIGQRQMPLENIHCYWDFGGISSTYTYIDALNGDISYTLTINTTRDHLGLLNTTLVCSNLVSNMSLWETTHVILDAVILDSLENKGTIFLTNATEFVLTVQRFGTRSCFQWDMGNDERGFLYGLSLCASYAEEEGLQFIEIPFALMTIEHNYTFPQYGNYDVTVFAFNHVSNDTMANKAVVMDWLCFAPNITVHNGTEDADSPLRHMKCQNLRLVVDIQIHCWKTHSVQILWEVKPASDMTNVLMSQQDIKYFDYTTRMLPYGVYVFQITAHMKNVSQTTKIEESYIEITKCPLNVSLVGGPVTQVKMKTSYILNAIDITFDPDVEPLDKSGLQFSWFCNRTDITKLLKVFSEDQITIFEGCFMDGFDLTSHSEGRFLLEASQLLPMSWHHIRITVTKDTRSEQFDKMVYINPQEPPIVVIG